MPQMNKGGKYIFGMSVIREDGSVQFPTQAVTEYLIAEEGKVYLFTGSKSTGGFCVTRRGLLLPSKLGKILEETPALRDYTAKQGNFVPYKGRSYCWTEITQSGQITLTEGMMAFLPLPWAQKGHYWKRQRISMVRFRCFHDCPVGMQMSLPISARNVEKSFLRNSKIALQ